MAKVKVFSQSHRQTGQKLNESEFSQTDVINPYAGIALLK